ncbi:hypothetical protein CVT25_005699 [Psilocybe cyanescens]|uniref:Protein kinase domain-containing protein n=1 Tax=Psilocybe cyanescens TaxID=93625 RepID=A0A409VLJ3_PSICY|nr:hypothetical protein CVT25_005699 [Psilocybe cyanescens]
MPNIIAVIHLTLNKPIVIGRNPELCSYVVTDALVSGVHCKLYAVRSPCGGIIISCQDVSRNGILLNGQCIRKTSIILMDGDMFQLPNSLVFTCIHIWLGSAEKLSLFEPTPPLQPIHKRIGKYVVTSQCLGTGSFATVHLTLDPDNHRQVACKSIRTKRDSEVGQVMKEVRILMTLKHPNINEIYDTEENKKFIHIFLQLCTGGDLFTYITNYSAEGNRICEAEAKYIMYQLLKGLNRKTSFSTVQALILAFSLQISDLPAPTRTRKHSIMPSDCWSAGVILYIMLSGSHPFDNEPRPSSCSVIWGENSHQSYANVDIKVKQKIIYADVEYHQDPWKELEDGMYFKIQ